MLFKIAMTSLIVCTVLALIANADLYEFEHSDDVKWTVLAHSMVLSGFVFIVSFLAGVWYET